MVMVIMSVLTFSKNSRVCADSSVKELSGKNSVTAPSVVFTAIEGAWAADVFCVVDSLETARKVLVSGEVDSELFGDSYDLRSDTNPSEILPIGCSGDLANPIWHLPDNLRLVLELGVAALMGSGDFARRLGLGDEAAPVLAEALGMDLVGDEDGTEIGEDDRWGCLRPVLGDKLDSSTTTA